MKMPAPGTIIVALLATLFIGLVTIALRHRPHERSASASAAPPAGTMQNQPGSISVKGITLRSISIDLPDDLASYPDGPHADVINNDCRACHSATMALYQPRLSASQWHKEVEKMRNTFGAPVPEEDVPDIVAYLTAMSARLPENAQ